MKPLPAVALIDGEHYPPVVVDALAGAAERYDFRGALFLGGIEKIRSGDFVNEAERIYGLPVVFEKDWEVGLRRLDRAVPSRSGR